MSSPNKPTVYSFTITYSGFNPKFYPSISLSIPLSYQLCSCTPLEILRKVKDLIEKKKKKIKNIEKVKEYFYILEGSDWNWWNTFDEPTGSFRKIYLSYVKKIFQILKEKPPKSLKKL